MDNQLVASAPGYIFFMPSLCGLFACLVPSRILSAPRQKSQISAMHLQI